MVLMQPRSFATTKPVVSHHFHLQLDVVHGFVQVLDNFILHRVHAFGRLLLRMKHQVSRVRHGGHAEIFVHELGQRLIIGLRPFVKRGGQGQAASVLGPRHATFGPVNRKGKESQAQQTGFEIHESAQSFFASIKGTLNEKGQWENDGKGQKGKIQLDGVLFVFQKEKVGDQDGVRNDNHRFQCRRKGQVYDECGKNLQYQFKDSPALVSGALSVVRGFFVFQVLFLEFFQRWNWSVQTSLSFFFLLVVVFMMNQVLRQYTGGGEIQYCLRVWWMLRLNTTCSGGAHQHRGGIVVVVPHVLLFGHVVISISDDGREGSAAGVVILFGDELGEFFAATRSTPTTGCRWSKLLHIQERRGAAIEQDRIFQYYLGV
mmetsp:Transcript_6890/g.14065  ORF Transcript_6890/g.14065 Transcript_6890/m.14065 type:complete len:373 (+) Transcript_6890:656-1774(+)